jgi:DNA-binding LacI/PurR family transcriptional regulator
MSKRPPREPLHRRIAAALRREVLRARPGQLLGSQNELARRFRVSALTVREALSALEEEGLIERRQGSGTYVADPARRQHVAILIELDISHPRTSYYYLRLTQQLRVILKEKGFRPRLYAGHVGPDTPFDGQLTCHEFLEDLEAGRICGVAAVALDAHESWMRLVREKGIPVVGSGVGYEYEVVLDVGKLVRSGIEYLTAHGRRRIAFLAWGPAKDFVAALKQRGLEVREGWLRHDLHPSSAGAGWEELREVWAAYPDKPDGLLISDDLLFADARTAVLELGIEVPRELLIVTHANRGMDFPAPFPVTRMEVDPDVCAQAFAALLGDLLCRRTPSSKTLEIPFWVVPPGAEAASSPVTPQPEEAGKAKQG